MKIIGKGQFTKVYRLDSKKVGLISTDPVKEAMAIGMFPKSKLFPVIDSLDDSNEFDYIMNYDPDLKERSVLPKLNPYYQNLYKQLKTIDRVFNRDSFFRSLARLKGVRIYHKNALKKAFECLINYAEEHQIKFEISPRNVSTKNGRLILNDCFFLTIAEPI